MSLAITWYTNTTPTTNASATPMTKILPSDVSWTQCVALLFEQIVRATACTSVGQHSR